MVLCTTHSTRRAAVDSDQRRWATAGRCRHVPSGWDGQDGWDLEPVLNQARGAAQGERIVGLWALGTLLQPSVGSQVAHGPAPHPGGGAPMDDRRMPERAGARAVGAARARAG